MGGIMSFEALKRSFEAWHGNGALMHGNGVLKLWGMGMEL